MAHRRRSALMSVVVALLLICADITRASNTTETPTPVPTTSASTTATPVTQAPPTTAAPTSPPPTQPPTAPPSPPPTAPPATTAHVVKPTPPPPTTSPPGPPSSSSPATPPPSPTTSSVNLTTEPPAATTKEPSHTHDGTPSPTSSPSEGDSYGAFDQSVPTTSPSSFRASATTAGPSSSSQEASQSADDSTNGSLTIILSSVLAGMVCVVVAAVIVRRRIRSASGDDKTIHGINTSGGSMVFMESTRPSSVPVLQSNNRVYEIPNLLALPAPQATKQPPSNMQRTISRREEPRTEESSSMYRLSSSHHISVVDYIDTLGNMTRISEAENSDGSSAATTLADRQAGGGGLEVRGTEDLCRFTQASDRYSEGTYDGDHFGFPSDVSRETGWSIGSEKVSAAPDEAEWGAPPPAHDVRSTDDLLQSTRSMVSIDDSSVRGSSDVWLDTSRFNAMVSTDVHIF